MTVSNKPRVVCGNCPYFGEDKLPTHSLDMRIDHVAGYNSEVCTFDPPDRNSTQVGDSYNFIYGSNYVYPPDGKPSYQQRELTSVNRSESLSSMAGNFRRVDANRKGCRHHPLATELLKQWLENSPGGHAYKIDHHGRVVRRPQTKRDMNKPRIVIRRKPDK